MKSRIIIEDWGLVNYLDGLERQKNCVESVIAGAPDHLIGEDPLLRGARADLVGVARDGVGGEPVSQSSAPMSSSR